MIFTELTESEFTSFVQSSDQRNFMQTSEMATYYAKDGQDHYLVGVKEGQQVKAATLLIRRERKLCGQYTFDCPQGPILDYRDPAVLSCFTDGCARFVRRHHGYRFLITPYIIARKRSSEAQIVAGNPDQSDIRTILAKQGYTDLDNYLQTKWLYMMDLGEQDEKTVFRSFKPTARNQIHRTQNKYKLQIRELTKSELPEFKAITQETSNRRGFEDRPLSYYEQMMDSFGSHCRVLLAQLPVDAYIADLRKEIDEGTVKLEHLSDHEANEGKKKELRSQIAKNRENLSDALALQRDHGNTIPLAASMFLYFPNEVVYLFSGSLEEYNRFFGQYAIQWNSIQYAIAHHIPRYNFYGILDVFNPDGPDYGVLKFKQSFNGYVAEMIGTFEYPVNLLGKLRSLLRHFSKPKA